MNQFGNLSANEQANVDAKLAELQQQTGRSWACTVTQRQDANGPDPLLEIVVDGNTDKPIELTGDSSAPAERICRELDQFAAAKAA